MTESTAGRVRVAVKRVFGILEECQAGDDFTISEGLEAVIAGSENPGRDVVDIALCALSIVQDRRLSSWPAARNCWPWRLRLCGCGGRQGFWRSLTMRRPAMPNRKVTSLDREAEQYARDLVNRGLCHPSILDANKAPRPTNVVPTKADPATNE